MPQGSKGSFSSSRRTRFAPNAVSYALTTELPAALGKCTEISVGRALTGGENPLFSAAPARRISFAHIRLLFMTDHVQNLLVGPERVERRDYPAATILPISYSMRPPRQ